MFLEASKFQKFLRIKQGEQALLARAKRESALLTRPLRGKFRRNVPLKYLEEKKDAY